MYCTVWLRLFKILPSSLWWVNSYILDEIFIFRDTVMPEHQLIEENENIAKRDFFDFVSFRSGLNIAMQRNKQTFVFIYEGNH